MSVNALGNAIRESGLLPEMTEVVRNSADISATMSFGGVCGLFCSNCIVGMFLY